MFTIIKELWTSWYNKWVKRSKYDEISNEEDDYFEGLLSEK